MFGKIIFFLFFLFSSLFAQELKKVTLQLSWFDQFQFAGYYMAKEKGFYEKVGLDVEIKNGTIILSKTFKHKTLEERVLEYRGKLGPYEEFDWGEAEGREQW